MKYDGLADEFLARAIYSDFKGGRAVTATWLNHWSIFRAKDELCSFDFIGIDGVLLKRIANTTFRTSADRTVPALLSISDAVRVYTIGGHPSGLAKLRAALTEKFGRTDIQIVGAMDGYAGLLRGDDLAAELDEKAADIVLVGLGAGLQEKVVLEATGQNGQPRIALTCGGFLDQIQESPYYPDWAYPLRLNWLIRLAKEPRRLWRRYTVDALYAILKYRDLRRLVRSLRGVDRSTCSIYSQLNKEETGA